MRLKLTLAYEGGAFQGWQLQLKRDPPPTIQGAVETALFTLLREHVRVHGASRTDSGVHALGQVAHCDVPERDWDWRKRLNSVLPPDIRIIAAEPVADSFHARKNAKEKTYIYRLWQEQGFVLPEVRNYVWQCGLLDLERINAGLANFVGEHDFASFQNSGTEVKTTVRKITRISMNRYPDRPGCPVYLPELFLSVSGTGFLKQMVRNIAGYVVAVGRGKADWDDLAKIINARSRACLPTETAPAQGLCLYGVRYD